MDDLYRRANENLVRLRSGEVRRKRQLEESRNRLQKKLWQEKIKHIQDLKRQLKDVNKEIDEQDDEYYMYLVNRHNDGKLDDIEYSHYEELDSIRNQLYQKKIDLEEKIDYQKISLHL